jgi:hypothetical protein
MKIVSDMEKGNPNNDDIAEVMSVVKKRNQDE